MKIHHAFDARPADARPLVLAIGFFDGFHRGHREILRTLLALRRSGFRAAAITFRNHPAQYLRPGSEPPLITTCEERVNLLASTGIDALYLIPFDERLAKQDARAFLEETIVTRLRGRALVFGENFHFGAGRAGDSALASEVLAEHRVALHVVPPLMSGGDRVSSTRIRGALVVGDLAAANELLGEPYTLRGRVILGEGRGHDLGFPTANLSVPPQKLVPKDGVYAIAARYDGRDYRGLASIGTKPTFDGHSRTVEAWLLDFHRTIYGDELTLRDFRFIREQRKFASVDELIAQMREDAAHAPYPSIPTLKEPSR
jgi:riboflavin kinase/FMN adenylyltransferase